MGIKVVSPLWLSACVEAGQLVEELKFKPAGLVSRVLKRQQPENAQDDLDVEETEERKQTRHKFVETMQKKKKDEMFFQKEYAKDVKRMGKTETHKRDIVD